MYGQVDIKFVSCNLDNQAPEILSLTAVPNTIDEEGNSSLTANATDSDGDELAYQWTTTDGVILGDGSSVTFIPPDVSESTLYAVTVEVLDGRGGSDTTTVDITVDPIADEGQRPWNDNNNGVLFKHLGYDETWGYHFTPQKNGQITKLGGYFNGTKTVKLWNSAGVLLAQAQVTSANNWSYTSLVTPVDVAANESYTVAVYLGGWGGSIRQGITGLPRIYGDIQITGGTAIAGDVIPTISIDLVMYGQVDIDFTPDPTDDDNDGYPLGVDCDDTDPDVHPGATEILNNGKDDDCDGSTPDTVDADGDGYNVGEGPGYDCNDVNPAINPGADEVFDGIDNNCNGEVDEGFTDADGDGYAAGVDDCDDNNATINPGIEEVLYDGIDNDCDPTTGLSITNPIHDQVIDEGVLYSFTIASDTFTGAGPLNFSATRADDTPLPGWLSFDASSQTFSGTPTSNNRGLVAIKVTVTSITDEASDDFNLTVIRPSVLHLDAVGPGVTDTDSNGTLDSWNDLSGNGNNAYQTTEDVKPLIIDDAINGHRAIEFDGVDDVLTLDDSVTLNTGGPYTGKTIIVTFRTGDDVTSRQVLFEQGDTTRGLNIYVEGGKLYLNGWNLADTPWGQTYVTGEVAASTDYVAALIFDSVSGTLSGYLNGTSMMPGSGSATDVFDLYGHDGDIGIGGVRQDTYFHDVPYSGDGEYFGGLIEGLIYFNEVLNTYELTGLYQSLADKLLISGNSVPVLNIVAPTDGTTFFKDIGSITFTGTAGDVESGDLSAFIQWSSDLDGDLGTGATITPTLSEGLHTITASITDGGGLSVEVSIAISTLAGITVTPTSGLTTTEEGETATFEVVLGTEPTADVTIGLSSNDTTEGTVSPASLTFMPSEWNTPKSVMVTGVDDDEIDIDTVYNILTAAATSDDLTYDGINPPDVEVINSDIDIKAPTITTSYPADSGFVQNNYNGGFDLEVRIVFEDTESGMSAVVTPVIRREDGSEVTYFTGSPYNDHTIWFIITDPEDQEYVFTVELEDSEGNNNSGETISFTVDNDPPETTVNQDGGTFSGPFTVTLSADEPGSTIHYSTDNYQPFIGSSISGLSPVEVTIDRSMNLQFFAVDKALNEEYPLQSEVYLLGAVPDAVTGVTPVFDAIEERVELTWDTVAGVSEYRVYRCLSQYDVDILIQSHDGGYPPPERLRISDSQVGTAEYNDPEIVSEVTYHYGVTAVDADGNEGKVSTLASVDITGATSGDNDPYLKAMAWLESAQNEQGYWGNKRGARMLATCQVLNAYKLMEKGDAGTHHALFYLRGNFADNNDYLARKILTLNSFGQNVDKLTNRLYAQSYYTSSLKGWGIQVHLRADALSTALGAMAIDQASLLSTWSTFSFLKSDASLKSSVANQYSWKSKSVPSVFVSSLVYNALDTYYSSSIFDSSWISGAPNANDSFGNGLIDTCAVLLWISNLDVNVRDSAVNYIILEQNTNGSWNDDPYLTGLCVKALKKSGYVP